MIVLVTGSNGFIAQHVINHLLEHRHGATKVVGVSRHGLIYPCNLDENEFFQEIHCNLELTYEVKEMMHYVKPDVVIHLAGNPCVNGQDWSILNQNVGVTNNILRNCKPGTRFVLASSCTVYGDNNDGLPFNEEAATNPTSVYGASKVAAEAIVQAYHNQRIISGLSLRLAATVGSGMRHGLVKDIVKKLLSDSENLELIGEYPGSHKPFTHVKDVAAGIVSFTFSEHNGVINLCNNDEMSVAQVAETVMDSIGIHKPIVWLGNEANWRGDNPVVSIDNSVAHYLGWRPYYDDSDLAVCGAAAQLAGEQ